MFRTKSGSENNEGARVTACSSLFDHTISIQTGHPNIRDHDLVFFGLSVQTHHGLKSICSDVHCITHVFESLLQDVKQLDIVVDEQDSPVLPRKACSISIGL